ncbi:MULTISPECIES: NUDIX domain-containing protein [Methylophaga]|uniref:ADP-ribose pyrophosphatase n=1 Tax=Methylophaga marina TaxID=45495 RepID=A0ABP3D2U2_9GAMM|nr:NUDIX domain-containing protein [Methylophaga marina]BDZ75158.1 ADP-ribose diphosphatase [Methylophaga marina]
MTKKSFKVLNQKTVYKGFFSVKKYTLQHTLYHGGWSQVVDREVFHRGDCIAVLLYDPYRDEVVIIEQFRAGAILTKQQEEAWLLEIVAGAVEENETPEDVAIREAHEEAGCEVMELMKINAFYTSPGGTSECLTLFCGKVDTSEVGGVHGLAEEDEDIAVSVVKFEEAYKLVETSRIQSAIPIIAIQWLKIHRESLREQWT